MMNKNVMISAAMLLLATMNVSAQGTLADYNRAYASYGAYNGKVTNAYIRPAMIGEKDAFWYTLDAGKGTTYLLVDAKRGTKQPLFDHQKMAKQLSSLTKKDFKADKLDLDNVRVNDKGDQMTFEASGMRFSYDLKKNKLSKRSEREGRQGGYQGAQRHWMEVDDENGDGSVNAPDGSKRAYIREYNVWMEDLKTHRSVQLSHDGAAGFYYSDRLQWSPDSKKVMSCKLRPATKHYVYYVESSPTDQLQPKLHKQEYAKPGDELNFKIPCIFNVESHKALQPATTLFDHQYELQDFRWDGDSRAITFEYNERGHKIFRVLELSAETGEVRTLIEEKADKYVNYPFLMREDLSDGRYIIWSSERDNYNNLYLYDRTTAQVDHQITKGKWYVRKIERVDEKNHQIYFSANGDVAGEDPYFIHYYRINLDGTGLVCLTPEHAMHNAQWTPDYQYLIDTYSTVDTPPVTVLRSASDGHLVTTLAKADASALLATGWKAPEVFTAPGRDGKTDMWGVIVRPSNFDPNKKYPVIEYIYSGPGSQYVPKTFRTFYYDMMPLAELGFIVVQVDGMGTSYRSREFENVCYKNLKDAGLPDHIAWLKAAAQKYPYMDISRVGIFGASAGGQESTGAVLFHPEFYKAAYSGCGCHDNRMDKIWWNELWMGYPVDSSYEACSNTVNAWRLTRPLMLVVGELDDNVDPSSTMQVANALIKANKPFELVVIPGAHHTMGESFGDHKRYDFFVKQLLGVDPPAWKDIKY